MANDNKQTISGFKLPDVELQFPDIKPQLTELETRMSEKLIEFQNYSLSFAELTKEDYKLRLSKKKLELESRNRSPADLLDLAANLILEEEANDLEIQAKDCQVEGQELLIESLHLIAEHQRKIIKTVAELRELADIYSNAAEEAEANCEKYLRKNKAIKAANALHDLPGGSRAKKENIRTIWASGKYTSRDICAEQECAALEMSFSAARKALRNTPEPA